MKAPLIIIAAASFLLMTACSHVPPVAVEVGYDSPRTGIEYKVKRNTDGSYIIDVQK